MNYHTLYAKDVSKCKKVNMLVNHFVLLFEMVNAFVCNDFHTKFLLSSLIMKLQFTLFMSLFIFSERRQKVEDIKKNIRDAILVHGTTWFAVLVYDFTSVIFDLLTSDIDVHRLLQS